MKPEIEKSVLGFLRNILIYNLSNSELKGTALDLLLENGKEETKEDFSMVKVGDSLISTKCLNEVKMLICASQKIQATKTYREELKRTEQVYDLKRAKDLVEVLIREMRKNGEIPSNSYPEVE